MMYMGATGTELFLRNLRRAGLIEPYLDHLIPNPYDPRQRTREILCRVMRSADVEAKETE